ncbi:hypothetical protein PVAG01_11021 [Phlyctema vagabunda]|uniref:Uncharacterized protein n=1 Tax=Phlyctema vagabunda TaxID=108571 RepID=A0ABR4P4J7_9HELO
MDLHELATCMHLDTKELYRVLGKLQIMDVNGLDTDTEWKKKNTRYLLTPAEKGSEIIKNYAVMEVEDLANSKVKLHAPTTTTTLHQLIFADDALASGPSFSLGYGSEPLPANLVGLNRKYGIRGYPPDTISHFEPTSYPSLTSPRWEALVYNIGKEVDAITAPGAGNATHLLTRTFGYQTTSDKRAICTISVQPAVATSVRSCIYQIQHIFCASGFYDVGLQINPYPVTRAIDEAEGAHDTVIHAGVLQVSLQPQLGASIGPDGTDCGGGTLGGYITLSKDGNPLPGIFAMTNHHVIASKLKYECERKHDSACPRAAAIPCNFDDANSIYIQSPTKVLQEKALAKLGPELKEAQEDLRQAKATKLGTSTSKAREIEYAQQYETALVTTKKYLAQEFPLFGKVFASSGLSPVPADITLQNYHPDNNGPWISEMDWALVEVDHTRVKDMPCNTSPLRPSGSGFLRARQALQNGKLSYGSPRAAVEHDKDLKVFCITRYQRICYGTFNKRLTRVLLPGTDHHKGTLVYSIHPSEDESCLFGLPGSSGSWAIDGHGTVLALLVGIEEGGTTTYLIDMDEVMTDIKNRTGLDASIA